MAMTTSPPLIPAPTLAARDAALGRVSLGDGALDAWLGGGLPARGVVEVTGEAGAGKTQLLLSVLLASAAARGAGGVGSGALYVCTEGKAPVARLSAMAGARSPPASGSPSTSTGTELERVLVLEVGEAHELWDAMHTRVPLVLRSGAVRLVVVDSIAAPFRGEFGAGSAPGDRTAWLFGLAAQMHRLSDEHDALFLVANQVSFDPGLNRLKPALGLAWSTCVTERLVLEFAEPEAAELGAGRLRALHVSFSNWRLDGHVATVRFETRGPVAVRPGPAAFVPEPDSV